jgi:hypothetical protein
MVEQIHGSRLIVCSHYSSGGRDLIATLRRAAGSITADWRPIQFAWSSLFTEMDSLFRITGNLSLRPRKYSGISGLIRSEEAEIGEIPCIFPV